LRSGAPYGTYNLTNGGEPASWADVVDAPASRPPSPTSPAAVRPLNSVLDLAKITATGFRPSDWRTALAEYLESGV
jgi:dTDP-4-dehydrorhamnose 3,5-epimerase